jgi:hypothetical protein
MSYFGSVVLLSPLWRGYSPLNNLEFVIPKEDLYQVWLKLASWFRRRNSVYFYSFAIISPWARVFPFKMRICCIKFGIVLVLHLNDIESPLPKDDLCQVWLKLAQWFENVKVYWQMDGRTTVNGRSEKLSWAFSSVELIIPSKKKLNLGHNFLMLKSGVLIFHMSICCDQTFLFVPNYLPLWPWC